MQKYAYFEDDDFLRFSTSSNDEPDRVTLTLTQNLKEDANYSCLKMMLFTLSEDEHQPKSFIQSKFGLQNRSVSLEFDAQPGEDYGLFIYWDPSSTRPGSG